MDGEDGKATRRQSRLRGLLRRRPLLLAAAAVLPIVVLVPSVVLALGHSGGSVASGVDIGAVHQQPAPGTTGPLCRKCHTSGQLTADDPGLKPDVGTTCAACHRDEDGSHAPDGGSVHPPVARGGCLDCHQMHGPNDGAGRLKLEVDKLCFSCHQSKARLLSETYAHPPFAQGQCTACHDPHRSSLPALLKAAVPDLCLNCHQSTVDAVAHDSNVHPPFRDGECTACHTPHASSTAGQLRSSAADVCLGCHGDSSHIDPQQPHVARGLCVSCHQPHGSDTRALLRDTSVELCLSCHRK